MPYARNADLPAAVRNSLPRGGQTIFRKAFNRRLLGAAILGVGADEAVHCVTDVMYCDAPCTVLRKAVHIHPTVAELIPTVLGDLEPLS